MAFSISPAVTITEKDLSAIIPETTTTTAGFCGRFDQGPVDKVIEISSQKELFETFGPPNVNERGVDWWTCANFLAYSDKLKVVRVDENQISGDGGGLTQAKAIQELSTTDGPTSFGSTQDILGYSGASASSQAFIFAKDPGVRGNSLRVAVFGPGQTLDPLDPANASDNLVPDFGPLYTFASGDAVFSYTPTSTSKIFNKVENGLLSGATLDEMHIAVIDHDGSFSGNQAGITGVILEKFEGLSRYKGATDLSGNALYYKDVINDQSEYIQIETDPNKTLFGLSAGTTGDAVFNEYTTTLAGNDTRNYNARFGLGSQAGNTFSYDGGYYGDGVTTSATNYNTSVLQAAYNKHFKDPLITDVDLLLGGAAGPTMSAFLVDLAEERKDCIAFISPPANVTGNEANDITFSESLTGLTADAVITYRTSQGFNTSYAFLDSGWKYQFDQYNDVFRWFPLNGDIAGLVARTEDTTVPFFSPAGFNRGKIKNVVKLAYNPQKADRDRLYQNGINPVVSFPGEGTVLFGDKTLQRRPSALDRINVRRLLISLEKSISTAAKFQLFEQNDAFTRRAFVGSITPFLRKVQSQRGITDFRVICDETNNTSDVVSRNQFVADILIKPTQSVNFISLNFSVLRADASFEETLT